VQGMLKGFRCLLSIKAGIAHAWRVPFRCTFHH